MISMMQIGPELDDGHNYESAKTDLGKIFTPRKTNLLETQTFDKYNRITTIRPILLIYKY